MIDQKEIQQIKRLHATSNTCNANVEYLLSAVELLQSQLEQLRAENERLRLTLTPFTQKGQLFIFHRNVEEGDYFECLFCHREAKSWKEIPHDQMLCPIAHAQTALKCSELTAVLEKL